MQKCDCQQDNQLSIYLIKMEQIEWKKNKRSGVTRLWTRIVLVILQCLNQLSHNSICVKVPKKITEVSLWISNLKLQIFVILW